MRTKAATSKRKRALQIDSDTKKRPKILERLNDWQYVERSIHRLMAAWGRHIAEWDDKSALHRHVWDQAECVRRLRERIAQFPGGRTDPPVSRQLENLANVVLLAPSLEDALDGTYQILETSLVRTFLQHVQQAHPVHDAPTIQMLHEILSIKEQHRLWLRDRRRRHPHTTDAKYRAAIEQQLAACGYLDKAIPVGDEIAHLAGVSTCFRLPALNARLPEQHPRFDFMPYLKADFARSIEARRLFWCYGYMLEKNLPDEQLRWIYDGHFMPWEFHYDISRHLWDESRHGDSGYSRLLDFGIRIEEIGFPPYAAPETELKQKKLRANAYAASVPATCGDAKPLDPKSLYEAVFFIGLVAETGHFQVKEEAYQDFRDGGDLESAEMMLFDIIDETAHVQYAHRWLPALAEHAGIDNTGYRERAAAVRRRAQEESDRERAALATLDRSPGNPNYNFYQNLLARMRRHQPLGNAGSCPSRSTLPM
ncbi:MAG TPA: hypothetical protein VMP11_18350 [Verrucomicrobiae bacterium]|nr:hypothetical protein [Verrucomicrobiae bacterium]